jgi:hypothetical protein
MTIDTSEHPGKSTTTSTRTEACDEQPAANMTVALKAGERVIGEARTDGTGRAELSLAAGTLTAGTLRLEAQGRSIAARPEVDGLLAPERAAAESAQAAAAISKASVQAPAPKPERQLFPEVPASGGGRVSLAGVVLPGAGRGNLEVAMARAGAARVETAEKRERASRFDLAAFAMHGLTSLDLAFDDADRFVAAKLFGDSAATAARLLETLRARYGEPQIVRATATQPERQVWTLARDLEMSFAISAEQGMSLVIVDQEAMRAARSAEERKRRAKR